MTLCLTILDVRTSSIPKLTQFNSVYMWHKTVKVNRWSKINMAPIDKLLSIWATYSVKYMYVRDSIVLCVGVAKISALIVLHAIDLPIVSSGSGCPSVKNLTLEGMDLYGWLVPNYNTAATAWKILWACWKWCLSCWTAVECILGQMPVTSVGLWLHSAHYRKSTGSRQTRHYIFKHKLWDCQGNVMNRRTNTTENEYRVIRAENKET